MRLSGLVVGVVACVVLGVGCAAVAQGSDEARWKDEAARVTIVRDDWGIAHVHGKTDADAVFGMIYAQCEDDFNRVETNYLTSLGRRAEAEGEAAVWQDLRQRLFIDPDELKRHYAASPDWLKKLMDAWADGINYYLSKHPETKPKALTPFEPWMALSFTEGSIGGDIERVELKGLEGFYGGIREPGNTNAGTRDHPPQRQRPVVGDPGQGSGIRNAGSEGAREQGSEPAAIAEGMEVPSSSSNGIAIAPANTVNHHALLLINPHTWFYFRSELQMVSDEGLDAYGAVTWGQFFVYQGFNDRAGWMHTSSNVDAVDEYLETVVKDGGKLAYRYGGETRAFTSKQITLEYKTATGMQSRTFTALYSLHGPVIAQQGDKYVTIQLMNTPVAALEQSYLRTKARSYAEYEKTMELRANSSNNTVFADADGNIAYWHGNFIPKRDTRFDYTKPVDGSDPKTNWQGLMTVEETPHLKNPKSGFLFNVNDSPWNGAGTDSLRKADFPAYVETGIESARGVHAMRMLEPGGEPRKDFTLESLMKTAFDSYLPWFARTVPELVKAYDALPKDAPLRAKLADEMKLMRAWDYRWGADSVQTSLGIYWGTELMKTVARPARDAKMPSEEWVTTKVAPEELLKTFATAVDQITADFGTWRKPWGEVNRFQRLNDDLMPKFDDAGPSIAVPFVYSSWGSFAAYASRQFPGTKRWYSIYGNTFVAVVEFGEKVRARAVTCGGESGDPKSPHFDDEAERYVSGNLREVYFYPEDLKGHVSREYRP